jgi:hypothetical protein
VVRVFVLTGAFRQVRAGLPQENALLYYSARILLAKPASTFAKYALMHFAAHPATNTVSAARVISHHGLSGALTLVRNFAFQMPRGVNYFARQHPCRLLVRSRIVGIG